MAQHENAGIVLGACHCEDPSGREVEPARVKLGYGNASKALEISRPAAIHILADETLLNRRSFIVMAREVSEDGEEGKVQLSKLSNMEGENGWLIAPPQQLTAGCILSLAVL